MRKFCIKLYDLYSESDMYIDIVLPTDIKNMCHKPRLLSLVEGHELQESLEKVLLSEPDEHTFCMNKFFKQIRGVKYKLTGRIGKLGPEEGVGSILSISPFMLFTGSYVICILPDLCKENTLLWHGSIHDIGFKDLILGHPLFPLVPVQSELYIGHRKDVHERKWPKWTITLARNPMFWLFLTCALLGSLLALLCIRMTESDCCYY